VTLKLKMGQASSRKFPLWKVLDGPLFTSHLFPNIVQRSPRAKITICRTKYIVFVKNVSKRKSSVPAGDLNDLKYRRNRKSELLTSPKETKKEIGCLSHSAKLRHLSGKFCFSWILKIPNFVQSIFPQRLEAKDLRKNPKRLKSCAGND